MSLLDWAKNEIEIACKKERGSAPNDEFDYGCACYESALKAFECLCEDGHSGMSIGITKNILNRLIDGKCLTPIYDVPEEWNEVWSRDDYTEYQCRRMSSLFKRVYTDGTVGSIAIILSIAWMCISCMFFSEPTGQYNYKATIDKDNITVTEYEQFIKEYHPDIKDDIYYFTAGELG